MNLLRGEFYKLFKGKAFYVCCLVAFSFVIFVYYMLFFSGAGQGKEGTFPVLEEITILEVFQQLFGNCGSFITAIFAAIFVIGEYANGAVKNIVGKGYKRWQIFTAKYFATAGAGMIILAFMCICTVIFDVSFRKLSGVSFQWDKAFLRDVYTYLGIQFLLGTGVVGVSTAISEMCRHMGAGISISFAMVGFSTMITRGIDMFLSFLLPEGKVSAADVWLMDLIINCPMKNIEGKYILQAGMAGIFWIALSLFIGIRHFHRTDIS